MSTEKIDNLHSVSSDVSFNDWLKENAAEAFSKIGDYAHGGGGFSLAMDKMGKTSKITGDISWKLRCRSHHAFGCPAAIKVVWRKVGCTLVVQHAAGWEHKHTGSPRCVVGLPPSVKVRIDAVIAANPGIKCKALKNHLWEVEGLSKELYEKKVEAYYYKGSQERRKSLETITGISSYGMVATYTESGRLFDKVATHTPGMNTTATPGTWMCRVLLATCLILNASALSLSSPP